MPYASRICSILPLWMESKALMKSTNINVACRFFCFCFCFFTRTPSRILRMVNICEVMDLVLRKPFWFFLCMLSTTYLLYKIYTSHFIARVRKGCSRFACERELETEHNCNILTPNLWLSALCLSRSTGGPGPTLLGNGFPYCILSASSLGPNSSGLLEGPFGRVWLSLPHLHSNSVRFFNSFGLNFRLDCVI